MVRERIKKKESEANNMAKKGQRISPDLKQQILKEAAERGIRETAKNHSIHDQTIYRWRQQLGHTKPKSSKAYAPTVKDEHEREGLLEAIRSLREKALQMLMDIEKLREMI